MPSGPKDVFVVHTKGDEGQRALTELLLELLPQRGMPVWSYQDWDWERPREHHRTYRSHGLKIDPVRFMLRDPKPFVGPARRPQVDQDTIRRLFRDSIVVALLEPRLGDPSAGVALERTILADLIQRRRNLYPGGPPILLRFPWDGSGSNLFGTLPIACDVPLSEFGADVPRRVLVDAVSAVSCAWLIHQLQNRFHPVVGHYLVHAAAAGDATIRTLSERSGSHRRLDFREAERASKEREAELGSSSRHPRESEDGRIERAMAGLARKAFEGWWNVDAAGVKQGVDELSEGPMADALATLVRTIEGSWKDAWERFLFCDRSTPFERSS